MAEDLDDPAAERVEITEGEYWLKNWGGGLPGVVNRDVHVVSMHATSSARKHNSIDRTSSAAPSMSANSRMCVDAE